MPILTAEIKPPKFYAIQAVMDNFDCLSNIFRDREVVIRSSPIKGDRVFSISKWDHEKNEKISAVSVYEEDYFLWEHGRVDASLFGITYEEFHERYTITGEHDTTRAAGEES